MVDSDDPETLVGRWEVICKPIGPGVISQPGCVGIRAQAMHSDDTDGKR